jgi:hypothetical protein
VSNCRHLTDRELEAFPLAKAVMGDGVRNTLCDLANRFEKRLHETKVRETTNNKQSGTIVQDIFHVSSAKPMLDDIDEALAKCYGLSDQELDFIINYDVKYRMGTDSDAEEE